MPEEAAVDFFTKGRAVAASLLVAAGLAGIIGSVLDWVVITPAGRVGEGPGSPFDVENASEPFTGLEAGDGWIVSIASLVIIVAGVLMLVRASRGFAWLAFLCAVAIGAIVIADYRGVEDLSSGISRRMDVVGDADPAFGLMLVGAAALMGLIGAAVGLAATPKSPRE